MNYSEKSLNRRSSRVFVIGSCSKRVLALAMLALVSLTMTARPASAQDPDWALKGFTFPFSGITSSEMAYDSVNGELILVTDTSGGGIYTWSWDGSSWTLLSSTGGFAFGIVQQFAYDQANQEMVHYDSNRDTWTWDGSTWSSVTVPGSPSLGAHAIAYDEVRQEVIVFGGTVGFDPDTFEDILTNETWAWDGSTWNLVATTGPSPRYGAEMVFDSVRGKVVLFGGFHSFGPPLGDTWEWDGNSWTEIVVPGTLPLPRFNFSMAYDPAREEVILFGGIDINGDENGNTWAFDGATWTQISSVGPSPRRFAAMEYDDAGQEMILVGGLPEIGGWQADTWGGLKAVVDCPGDINGDNTVDTADLGILIAAFGNVGASVSDLNGDMVVDTADLGILIGAFGAPCP